MDPVALANVFETLMLLGFAAAWPFNIVRSFRARTSVGTSPAFMIVVEFAYVCGMISKVVAGDITYVFAFYILDFMLVATGICIYLRNRAIDRSKGRIGRNG